MVQAAFDAHAAAAARLAARPEKPEGYALDLPKDFKPPEGMKFDESDPRIAAARAVAHDLGLDQAGFSRLLQIEAEHAAARAKAVHDATEAEIKKLGANGTARVTAAKQWLASLVGGDGAKQLVDRLVLASDIELVEKMQLAFSAQGGASLNGKGRDADPTPPPKTAAERMWPNGFQQKAR